MSTNGNKVEEQMEALGMHVNPAPREYVSSNGKTVQLMPVSDALIQNVLRQVDIPDRPTYTLDILGGKAQEKHYHTDKTIEAFGTPDEEVEWQQYKAKLSIAMKERNMKITRLILARGIVIPDQDWEAWLSEMKSLGAEPPEDATERRIFYIRAELLPNTSDVISCMIAVMALSDIPQEVVRSIEDSFRRALQRLYAAGRSQTESPSEREDVSIHKSAIETPDRS